MAKKKATPAKKAAKKATPAKKAAKRTTTGGSQRACSSCKKLGHNVRSCGRNTGVAS
jgi:hypothetical protein